MKHVISLLLLGFLSLGLFGCGNVQDLYNEVYVTVYNDQIVYYVIPGDGEATLSQNQMDEQENVFVYIFNAEDFESFSYDNFFSPLFERLLYKDVKTGRLYILNNDEIDTLIYEHSINYDTWKQNQNN
ncbi:MAG: hypothetical protein V3569_02585 [Acholeplasmataceae bacterium]|nr:hypothetical protein [Acholeplasmataceae bacterium]